MLEVTGIFWTPQYAYRTRHAPFAIQGNHEHLSFALGFGSETGFDTSNYVAYVITHHLVHALRSDTQPFHEAFVQAARSANDLLRAQFPDEGAGCSILGGMIRNKRIWISWLGSETAWHFRQGHLIAATRPQTFGNMAAAANPYIRLDPAIARVTWGALRYRETLDPSHIQTLASPWVLLSGDTVMLTTIDLWEYLDPHQVAGQLEGKSSRDCARTDGSLPTVEKHFGAAAIVIRVTEDTSKTMCDEIPAVPAAQQPLAVPEG